MYCGAANSCDGAASITNAKYLYCSGRSSCRNVAISGVQNVYITATAGALGATIDSNGVGVMNVYFAASEAGGSGATGVTVNCGENDFCNIYCLTNGACNILTEINTQCNNYNLVCDEANGIGCPRINDNSPSGCSTPSKNTEFLNFLSILFWFLWFVCF